MIEAIVTRPREPAGPFHPVLSPDEAMRRTSIDAITSLPDALGPVVEKLGPGGLDRVYTNWSARQIIHHLADSHMHALLRMKLALTTMHPTIMPYDEDATVRLADSASGPVEPALWTLRGVHARWATLLNAMTDSDFQLAIYHPQRGESVKLGEMLGYYAWHGRHHVAQLKLLADAG